MAQQEASIRLTIKTAGFVAGMRQLTSKVGAWGEELGKKMGQPMKKGLASAKESMKDLGSSMKDGIKNAAALGTGLVGGAMVAKVIEAEKAYMTLGSQIRDVNGQLITTERAQELVTNAANNTKVGMDEVRAAALQLSRVGPPNQVQDFTERAVLQAKRLGVESSLVARTFSRLSAKGLAKSADEAERLTETMYDFGRSVLGVDPDEAIDPNDMAEFAAFANTTGTNVQALTGFLKMTGTTVKDMGQAFEVVEELGLVMNTRKGLAELAKAAGLSKNQMLELTSTESSLERFLKVMDMGPKAAQAMQEAMGTDRARQAVEEVFGKELTLKLRAGKASKDELKTRAEEVRKGLAAAADQTKMIADIEKKDAEMMKSKSSNITQALNLLEQSFAKPKMMAAIERLTKLLPDIADAFANLFEFVVNNPMLAGGMFVGAKVGMSFAGGALQEAGGNLGAAFLKWSGGKLAASSVLAGGKWALAAKAGLVLAAGAIGFMIGKEIANAFWDSREKKQKEAQSAEIGGVNALGSKDVVEKRNSLTETRKAIAALKDQQTGAGSWAESAFGWGASLVDKNVKGTEVQDARARQIQRLQEQEQELIASIKKQEEANRKASQQTSTTADQVRELGRAAAEASKHLNGAPGAGGAPGPLPVAPGHGGI